LDFGWAAGVTVAFKVLVVNGQGARAKDRKGQGVKVKGTDRVNSAKETLPNERGGLPLARARQAGIRICQDDNKSCMIPLR
jgi:hypothetical protein